MHAHVTCTLALQIQTVTPTVTQNFTARTLSHTRTFAEKEILNQYTHEFKYPYNHYPLIHAYLTPAATWRAIGHLFWPASVLISTPGCVTAIAIAHWVGRKIGVPAWFGFFGCGG